MKKWSGTGRKKIRMATLATTASVIALGSGLQPAPVYAAAEGNNFLLEEIIITARKRKESAQDVPIAITTLSSLLIEDGNLDEMQEFVDLVPNVKLKKDGFTGSDISIRGSSRNLSSEDPGVGLNRDNVYMGGLITNFANFYDTERVEILRGPQAGLYGRNAVGGAVNVFSRRPDYDGMSGYVEGQYGTFQRLELRGALNVPVIDDKLAVRVSGLVIDQSKGQQKIVNQDQYADAYDNASVRGRVLFNPSDTLELLTTVEYFKFHGRPAGLLLNGPGGTVTVAGPGTTADDLDSLQRNMPLSLESEQIQFIQEANLSVGDGQITGVIGYRETTFTSSEDNDGTNFDVNMVANDAGQNAFFAEMRYASPADNKFRYTVGATYLNEDSRTNQNYTLGGAFQVNLAEWFDTGLVGANPFGVPVGIPIEAIGWTPQPGGGGWTGYFGDTFPVSARNEQALESIAAFAEASYQLTDDIELWANARYTRDTKSVDFGQVFGEGCTIACSQVFATFLGLNPEYADTTSKTFTKFSPGGGINLKINDDVMVYAKVVTGFKAGGFNDTSGSADNIAFGQENTISYEVGTKFQGWDKRLTLNAAGFYQSRSDAIVVIVDPVMPINKIGVNAGNITNKGLELEMRVVPTSGLQILLAGGYLDSTFKDFTTNGVDFTDNQVPNTYNYTFSGVVQYNRPITEDLSLFGYLSYTNAWGGYSDNWNFRENDSPETMDIRAGVKGEDWKLAFYVDNLFDHKYLVSEFFNYGDPINKTGLSHLGTISIGRTVGLQASFNF